MSVNDVLLVLVTVPDMVSAKKIAEHVVESKNAACVNIIPGLTSVYRWEGKVNTDSELLLLIKTVRSTVAALKETVIDLHPYDVPEFIEIGINGGFEPYLDWISNETN